MSKKYNVQQSIKNVYVYIKYYMYAISLYLQVSVNIIIDPSLLLALKVLIASTKKESRTSLGQST